MIPKLLVTGAGGFVGHCLCEIASAKYSVIGLYRKHPNRLPRAAGFQWIHADLTRYNEIKYLFAEIQPEAVIHTAAASLPNFCENHPEASFQINVTATADLAGLAADAGIPFVFTSTDLVFDGTAAPYTETDPPSPLNRYGRQKVQAEERIQALYPAGTICRLSLLYGFSENKRNTFEGSMIRSLEKGQTVPLFFDEYRTPLDIDSAARGLLQAIEMNARLLHLGGLRSLSRYEMGKDLCEKMGLPVSLLRSISQKQLVLPASRPADVSLDSSLARSAGFRPLDWESGIRQMVTCMQQASKPLGGAVN